MHEKQSLPDVGDRVMSLLARLEERHWGLQLGIVSSDASIHVSAGAPLPLVLTEVPGGFLDGAETVTELGMVALVHPV